MSSEAAPALRRGLAVLQLLASRATPVSAAAVARDLGLPRSTTYELLTELAAAGFAAHLPGERRWGLGLAAFEIGSAYLRGQPLERVGRPVLVRLSVAAAGTAHLGVLHGNQTLAILAGAPTSIAIACSSAAVNVIAPLDTAASGGLSYSAATDQYVYVWKTDKAWAGTCRQLIVRLADGTLHRANFELK